ncbi:MAG: DNA alkylation repair protein [Leadbetterella sp.]
MKSIFINLKNRKGFEMIEKIKKELLAFADPITAKSKLKYFKVLEENDKMLGVSNPQVQSVCKKYTKHVSMQEIAQLLSDPIHEYRYAAAVLLVDKYEKAKNPFEQQDIVDFYIDHKRFFNNWDLIDYSSYKILGHFFYTSDSTLPLEEIAENGSLWDIRIAVVSSLYFIKKGHFDYPVSIVNTYLEYPHDLNHKACGWMLKETWSRGGEELIEDFIKENYDRMHRTTLRYAIEKMPEKTRKEFLLGNFD